MTATRVEADPIGVMLPPRFAPKITAHHNGSVGGRAKPYAIGIPSMIFASMAASGILSDRTEHGGGDHDRTRSDSRPQRDHPFKTDDDQREYLSVLHDVDHDEKRPEEAEQVPVDGAVELVGLVLVACAQRRYRPESFLSTRPGRTPVTCRSSTTACPFTKTYSMPSLSPPGSVIVAWSCTRS